MQTQAQQPDVLQPGALVGDHFVIREQLGSGGIGAVYLAEHAKMERRVVIKVTHRAVVNNPDSVERFNREVRAAAKLDHPNVAKAYDAEEAGGLQLLTVELILTVVT